MRKLDLGSECPKCCGARLQQPARSIALAKPDREPAFFGLNLCKGHPGAFLSLSGAAARSLQFESGPAKQGLAFLIPPTHFKERPKGPDRLAHRVGPAMRDRLA